MGLLTSVSYSRLVEWEKCPYRIKLSAIDKIPEPPRDPETSPLARGERIHLGLELFVKGEGGMPREAVKFEDLLVHLQGLYYDGLVSVEQEWAFDAEWNPVPWRSDKAVWRIKLDFAVDGGLIVVVTDYKTGKSFGNEIKHISQTQLYAGVAALKFPKAQTIITEIWYIDEGWIRTVTYRRELALEFLARFEKRAEFMLSDVRFKPRPSLLNCKWCPYGPQNGNAACRFGV